LGEKTVEKQPQKAITPKKPPTLLDFNSMKIYFRVIFASSYWQMGLNMTVAMTMFLRQAVRSQSIPFEISRVPNAETVAAILEAESIARDPNIKGYTDLNELFRDLKS
jgi:DNA-damage-inducible protein J